MSDRHCVISPLTKGIRAGLYAVDTTTHTKKDPPRHSIQCNSVSRSCLENEFFNAGLLLDAWLPTWPTGLRIQVCSFSAFSTGFQSFHCPSVSSHVTLSLRTLIIQASSRPLSSERHRDGRQSGAVQEQADTVCLGGKLPHRIQHVTYKSTEGLVLYVHVREDAHETTGSDASARTALRLFAGHYSGQRVSHVVQTVKPLQATCDLRFWPFITSFGLT